MPIKVENLSYVYNVNTPAMEQALCGVTFSADRGEWLSIVGHTGSGKSTLAQHLNLLILPQSGFVEIDGQRIDAQSKDLRNVRKKVGLVFQYPEQQFFAETAREEIAFAPSNWGQTGELLERSVLDAAEMVGLERALLSKNPFAMSGGQRRRVALASVIVMKPDYLILDEPTAGLDAEGIRELAELLISFRRNGTGVIQVTHDLDTALANSDRILVLENGRSAIFDAPEAVAAYMLDNPVKGLVLPPLVNIIAGLRERGFKSLNLTDSVDRVMAVLQEKIK